MGQGYWLSDATFSVPETVSLVTFKVVTVSLVTFKVVTVSLVTFNVPTVSLHGTADPAVPAGNTQWLADQYGAQWAAAKQAAIAKAGDTGKWVAPKQMFVPLWNNPPTTYTQFFSDGTPDVSGPAVTGTNHYNYTAAQLSAFAQILVNAATNGHVQPDGTFRGLGRKAGGIVDSSYRAPMLPYYQK